MIRFISYNVDERTFESLAGKFIKQFSFLLKKKKKDFLSVHGWNRFSKGLDHSLGMSLEGIQKLIKKQTWKRLCSHWRLN